MTAAPHPLHFDIAAGWCFGWFHAPAAPPRGLAVVLCPPLGHEAVCSYPTQVQLASHLAAQGFPVLRFDYHGTGDASGDEHLPGRVQAWLDSIAAAVAQARTLAGTQAVALLGIRLGGTLAVQAAAGLGGVDSLLLWAPCASGKAFVRELRAGGTQDASGALHAMGVHYSADTVQALAALDLAGLARAPARRALVVGRDDLPGEGPVPRTLRAAGVEVQARVLPGYAAMVDEPRAGVLAPATLAALADWLAASPAAQRRLPAPAVQPPAPLQPRRTGEVIETLLQFDAGGTTLCGVLTEPADPRSAGRHHDTALVLLNVGGNYRIGPHRLYVAAARALAAAGWRVLRLDLAGIGDSPPPPGQPWARLYEKASAQDVRAAVDALQARGCRDIVLMGICSGSYVAFQSALAEPRVNGIVLMNSRLLEWSPGKAGDDWQDSMQQYAKSSDHYRRSLLKADTWARLLRGQVNVRLIGQRLFALAAAHGKRLLARGGADDGLRRKMQELCRRGTDVLMLVAEADDGRDYVEFHFGGAGRRMRAHPNFRLAYLQEADHTFSRPGNLAALLAAIRQHLEQRQPAPGEPQPDRYNRGLACRSSSVGRAAHS